MSNEPTKSRSQLIFNKHVVGLLESAKSLSNTAFSQEKTPERNQRLMRKIYQVASTNIEHLLEGMESWPAAQRAELEPKCSVGCDYCCYQWVRATPAEVLAVYRFVKENYSDQQLAELHGKLKQYKKDYDAEPVGSLFSLGCPLLIDHKCSVYESRPLICRGTTSSDADQCRKGKDDPSGDVMIPVLAPLLNVAAAMRQGLKEGLGQAGLDGSELVLGLALLILFEDPAAEGQFFAGERVFDSALAPDKAWK